MPPVDESSEKKIVKTAIYTITVNQFDDGTTHMRRVNDGFNTMELMGITSLITQEIIQQMNGTITPEKIIRQVMVDKPSEI